MDNNNANYINLDDEQVSKEIIEENKLKDYLNGIFTGTNKVVNHHLFGKIVSASIVVLIIFTIVVIPRPSYDFSGIKFERKNILSNLIDNNAIANEPSNQPTNQTSNNAQNNNFTNNNNLVANKNLNPFNNINKNSQANLDQNDSALENNFQIPPLDLTWVVEGAVDENGKPLSESGSLDLTTDEKIPRLSNAFDLREGISQVDKEMTGKVDIRTGVVQKVLSDKFDVGQIIKLVYNDKEYILKVEGKTLLDNETLLVVNRQIGEKIFNKEVNATIENVKIIK